MYVLSVLWCAVGVNVAATSVPTAVPTPAPLPACESSLLTNPSFDTLNGASSSSFSGGNVVGWAMSHGTPSLFGGYHGAYSAWMWSYSGKGEGVVTSASFTSGVQYRVTMWVHTKNPNGNIYVRIANGVPSGTTTSTSFPSVSSAQTVYTNTLVFTTAQEITFDFTANANYAQMWFYPLLTGPPTSGQAEFRIDNVRVCEMTTAAPTSVPVTDASGVIVDTPAPATVAPPTPVPATNAPATTAPETGAPVDACESSLLTNPSFDTLNGASSSSFSGGNVVGWAMSHGTPSLFGGYHGAYSAWMWSYSGKGEGVVTSASFTSGVQYRVTMWVHTKNPNGNIYVRIANGVPSGTTTSTSFPSVSSAQTVYTNALVFTTAQEITFDFTANANYAQMWFYPLLTGPPTSGQAEFRIDNVRVCDMTTAAPTSVPVTDASGVIVDTPAPATVAPPTPVPETNAPATTAPETGAPVDACESSLLTNPSFDTLNGASSSSFSGGNVVGWAMSHGTPSLFGGYHGAYSAWMWSYSGKGEGVVTSASFTSGVQYRVTMWVHTKNPNGNIYVRIANGVPSGTTTSTSFPSVSSAQTVYTNTLVFTTAQEITFDFTANANYAQMWFYPLLTGPPTSGQAEFRIDNVRVCDMTTAAPTAVPVTDASGVIVDTPAPATVAPPTSVPATNAPATTAPETGAPVDACESSLLTNPSFDTLNGASSSSFSGGNVVGWAMSHGTPSLFGGYHGAYSAWMWSYSGKGEGVVTSASFTSGVQYRVTMWVHTKNPNGNIYVRIANGVPSGTTTSTSFPSVSSAQTVYTNTLVFTTAQEITFDFTANANYAQMWFYPLLTGPPTSGQAEFRIDNVRVCDMTTAAPTAVPVTDASGVIVDTPAPATVAPPTSVPATNAPATTAPETGAPVDACESSLLTNPSFDTLNGASSSSFSGGNVVGWAMSHGTPSLFGGYHGAYSAWMWSYSGKGEGVVTSASFTSGVQYRVTMWVHTKNPNGNIYVRIANGVPSGTTTSTSFPSVSSAQTVYTNTLVFTTAQEITFDFTANANYAQMWFYPLLTGPPTSGQAEFRIDNVRVCEMTTAAPTSVPVTDASGVIVDTPAPATVAPPTSVPATNAPATTAPETGAPVDACESSLLTNPSFDTLNGASSSSFSGGNVVGWAMSHGTPSLFGGYHGAYSAWMWSYSGKGEGVVTSASFTSGVQYRVTMWVHTKNPNGNIYVRIANGVPSGTTTSTSFPSVSSAQTVYTNTLVFTTAQEITFDFTANANYAQMWFYPLLTGPPTSGQAEFRIDNVRVCEMTTAAPTSVPVTDASGVIVDTAVPATIAPPTPAPATPAPSTDAPDTSAPSTSAPRTTAPDTVAPLTPAPRTVAPDTETPVSGCAAHNGSPKTCAASRCGEGLSQPFCTYHAESRVCACPTSAPETKAPVRVTEAPVTKVSETEAPVPVTEAPDTMAPETKAPAPETKAPTPETSTPSVPTTNAPLTVEDVDWCDVDADCRTYDDSAATCVESKCVCTESEGFVNPVTKKTKETLFICVQPTKKGNVKLRLEWNVDCEQSNGAIEGAVRTAIEETTKGRTDTLVVSCGSTIFVVDVEDADITTAATEDMSELIVTSLKKNEAAVAAGFATPMTVGSSLVPTLKCSAAGATEMVLVNGGCVALACESGYLLSSGSCVEDDDSDDTLSTGAIVGIVLGCTAFVVMIIAVAAFFLCKGSKAEDTVCHPPHHTSTHCRPQLSSQKPTEPAFENEDAVNEAV